MTTRNDTHNTEAYLGVDRGLFGVKMRVAILCDAIANKGGAERLILSHAQHYKADIYTGYYSGKSYPEFKDLPIIALNDKYGGTDTLKIWVKFSNLQLDYDFYIFHGAGALNCAKHHHPNMWYCHSPSRYLYDLYDEELGRRSGLRRLFFVANTTFLRWVDKGNVRFVDKLVVNSKFTQDMVWQYYCRPSVIINPFASDKFKWRGQDGYYLSTARPDLIKNLNMVYKAFLGTDNKVVFTNGNNTDEEIAELYGNCIGTLAVSHKEPFGMVAVESLRAGKPVIAMAEGGYLETVEHKKTGYFIKNVADIRRAVSYLTRERALQMRQDCELSGDRYTEERFLEETDKVVGSFR